MLPSVQNKLNRIIVRPRCLATMNSLANANDTGAPPSTRPTTKRDIIKLVMLGAREDAAPTIPVNRADRQTTGRRPIRSDKNPQPNEPIEIPRKIIDPSKVSTLNTFVKRVTVDDHIFFFCATYPLSVRNSFRANGRR